MQRENNGAKKLLTLLRKRLGESQAKNPGYSLRAFAKNLGVAPTVLSEWLRGKRPLTLKQAEKVCNRLHLDPKQRVSLLKSIPKRHPNTWKPEHSVDLKLTQIESDQFKIISDWQHFAILSLLKTKDFTANPKWIATRLGITESKAKIALDRLMSLGLMTEHEGKWTPTNRGLTTTSDISDSAIKKYHTESLKQAEEALYDISVDLREISSSVFSCDLSRLSEAKEMLKKYRREVSAFLESGNDPTEVYRLSVQLIPITKKQGEYYEK